MSADPNTPAFDLYYTVNGMDSWLVRLVGLTQVLYCLAAGSSRIEPESVNAMASAVDDVATQIRGIWTEANDKAARAAGIPERPGPG